MAEIENLQIVGGAIYTVGNQDIIADDWEAGKAYIKDRSYAIKDHKLYQCAVSHTSVEPFDPTKWTEKTVAEALGTAGSANMIECTLAEYTAWKAGGQLINETVYVITDAPNLNATAQDISYDGGGDSVWDKVEAKAEIDDNSTSATKTWSSNKIYASTMDRTTTTLTAGTGCTIRYQHIYKQNGFVFMNFAISKSTDISSRTSIATLPEGFRPTSSVSEAYMIPASTSINGRLNRATPLLVTLGGELIVGDAVYPSGSLKEVCGSIMFKV